MIVAVFVGVPPSIVIVRLLDSNDVIVCVSLGVRVGVGGGVMVDENVGRSDRVRDSDS